MKATYAIAAVLIVSGATTGGAKACEQCGAKDGIGFYNVDIVN